MEVRELRHGLILRLESMYSPQGCCGIQGMTVKECPCTHTCRGILTSCSNREKDCIRLGHCDRSVELSENAYNHLCFLCGSGVTGKRGHCPHEEADPKMAKGGHQRSWLAVIVIIAKRECCTRICRAGDRFPKQPRSVCSKSGASPLRP
jgi:hypothetical protein